MTYKEYEKAIYSWLMNKHVNDPNFTFSVRQKGVKGAELDYFIGTQKSNYFGTTLWNIPVAYPGSSSDLVNIIFKTENDHYRYYIQFSQTKNPFNQQNKSALELVQNLKPIIKSMFKVNVTDVEKNKQEYFNFSSPRLDYENIDLMLIDLDKDLDKLIPIVDKEIKKIKELNKEFKGDRYTKNEFDNLISKMERRFAKYKNNELEYDEEDEIILTEENIVEPEFVYQPLNQILFGPPGTGKTYSTINKALKIINEKAEQELNWLDRPKVKAQFDKRVAEGRIIFTTFHQSMSYEDFIEGIKPETKGNDVIYEIEDGIFKRLANNALSNYENAKKVNENKLSFEIAFDNLKNEWDENPSIKFPLSTPGYDFTIIGFTNYSIQFKKASGGTSHTLSINTLKELYYGKEYNFKQGVGIYYPSILKKLESYKSSEAIKPKLLPYVIIIDEINRGNVSQIFGELITLIEEDKRIGKNEELKVTLPYSKELPFGVPPNLYIIGTMNTADRSIEALDTALRRRFVFEEILPKPELLSPAYRFWDLLWDQMHVSWENKKYIEIEKMLLDFLGANQIIWDNRKVKWEEFKKFGKSEDQAKEFDEKDFTGINLMKMLDTINKRLERLLDKDHQIGHAFFISVFSQSELKAVFENKIIPLLKEYFYGDFGKIGLVLGNSFIDLDKSNIKFANFIDYDTSIKEDYQRKIGRAHV